uniref:RRM domain-containing protein n=1 Tax=Syphacia muris TaxID=451379 RepID=A0A0N5AV53_9BILA
MDEEDVLLGNTSCDVGSLSEVDEAAVLGDDIVPEVSTHKDSIEDKEELDYDEDIDDDTEKTPRSSKFASERAFDNNRLPVESEETSLHKDHIDRKRKSSFHGGIDRKFEEATTVASQMPISSSKLVVSGRKVLMNPHYRGTINAQPNILNWSNMRPVNPPSARVQLRSCLQPSAQIGIPSRTYTGVPSSSADFSKPPPLVPLSNFTIPPPVYMNYTLPSHTAVITTVDDWSKKVNGFLDKIAAPNRLRRYSRSQSRSFSSSSRSRSRSYSSRSSSFSESSRSSHSSHRNSRTRGRRSISRRSSSRHIRRRSRSHSRYGDHGRSTIDKRNDRLDERKGQERRKGYYQDPNHQEKTIECAKAIGLDNEYLSKLEEQKKIREEILRKKEERRFQNVQRMGTTENLADERNDKLNYSNAYSSRRNDNISQHAQRSNNATTGGDLKKADFQSRGRLAMNKSALKSENKNELKEVGSVDVLRGSASKFVEQKPVSQISSRREGEVSNHQQSSNTNVSSSSNGGLRSSMNEYDMRRMQQASHSKVYEQGSQQSSARVPNSTEKFGRKKAYLAVVIGTANKQLPDLERMKLIASTVGQLKKVWVSSDESVSVIFESHDSAKQFMFKYNGRMINGIGLRISLQKVFANLAEL